MYCEKIKASMEEARRFIKRCEDALNEASELDDLYLYPSKHTGAVRRSSMDLTRSLADLRRREA